MDVDAYLDRIGMRAPVTPDLVSLERLQRSHLTHVAFENLDVFAHRPVLTAEDWSVPKIVERRRGGWCFELNGAFGWLLEGLGYEVRRLAATVLLGRAEVSPMPTHLTLQVDLERPYLVDVGFGDSFIRPLPLDSEGPHDGGSGPHSFIFGDGVTTLIANGPDGDQPQYRFSSDARDTEDFEEASVYLRTTPGLQWTQTRFATRLLDGGPDRVTLLEDTLKVRRDGVWEERRVTEAEWDGLLAQWFELTP